MRLVASTTATLLGKSYERRQVTGPCGFHQGPELGFPERAAALRWQSMAPAPPFGECFGEWVEACWLGEQDRAAESLDAVLDRPAVVLEAQSLAVVARMLEPFAAVPESDIADALVEHLMTRPDAPGFGGVPRDTQRAALIAAVVHLARSPRSPLADDPDEAAAALECASFLVQLAAERKGVLPTSIVRSL
jgi:hypothetical protein